MDPPKMAADPFAEQDVQCIATNHVGRAPWQTEQRMLAGRVLYGLLVRSEAVILFTNVQCLHVFPRLACAQLCIALEMLFRVLAGLCLVVVQHSTTLMLRMPPLISWLDCTATLALEMHRFGSWLGCSTT